MTKALRNALNDTPQSEPLIGRAEMVQNSEGGYVFALDQWARLDRFLILGTDGGTFYATERKATLDNINNLLRCVADDGRRAVRTAVKVSKEGLAPRNSQAIIVLAAAIRHGDDAVRSDAYNSIGAICRTGTHLFELLEYLKLLGKGWSRGLRNGVAKALASKDPDAFAYQAIKYRQREGWAQRDVLRLAHPKVSDWWPPEHRASIAATMDFMCGRSFTDGAPAMLNAFALLQNATSPKIAAELITAARLPWEAVPDRLKTHDEVWMALLAHMPVMATVRQLSSLARRGLLTPMGEAERVIVARLTDPETIRRSRAHPLAFLDALLVHASGGTAGLSRGKTYEPNAAVLGALDKAVELAFGNIEPAGKRTYIAVDVSASMTWAPCTGSVVLSPRVASAALALITHRTEPTSYVAAFSGEMRPLTITGSDTIETTMQKTEMLWPGGTDCAQPMLDATDRGIEVDTFVIYTDNETKSGRIHPIQALNRYRQQSGIPARLVVVGMTSTGFTIADPTDGGSLDVVGFSTATPNVISAFSRGDF